MSNENYRLSILSGEPDKVSETLFGNLFAVKTFPDLIYAGRPKFFNRNERMDELKKHMPYPFENFRLHENKLISLQNLKDPENPYSHLVVPESVHFESTNIWLNDSVRKNILVSLMNKEIISNGMRKGMWYDKKTQKLFFPSDGQKRDMSWPSKFKAARRTVVSKLKAFQLNQDVFVYVATRASFTEIGKKFFLQIKPTFIITLDGKRVISGMREGTVITKLSYNKYNDAYLNNILFWCNKLGNGEDMFLLEDFVVSCDPVKITREYGILWDIPTTELKQMIENYVPESEPQEIDVEVLRDEFTF